MKIITAVKLVYGALVKRKEYAKFVLAERLSALIYRKYKFSEFGRLFLEDQPFLLEYENLVGGNNYHSLDRKYALDQIVQLVTDIDGDTAECGAFEGASSWFICRRISGLKKSHHIFDSFEGLSEPGTQDGTYWTRSDLTAQEDVARRNLRKFDFVIYYKGWIPERFTDVVEKKFCFVHLDVDLYRPTLDSLMFFYGRTSQGGIILCDDYGFNTCPGAKNAMDEFFQDKPERIVHLPTGQAFIIKR